jgi:hypothetical protein
LNIDPLTGSPKTADIQAILGPNSKTLLSGGLSSAQTGVGGKPELKISIAYTAMNDATMYFTIAYNFSANNSSVKISLLQSHFILT